MVFPIDDERTDTMPTREASIVGLLLRRFGYREFRIRDLSNEDVAEMKETLLEYFANTDIGVRSRIGKKLNEMSRRSFRLENGQRVAIAIVLKAHKQPALYQVQRQS